MIFARKSDAALASLVKQLDQLVAEHADDKLSAFVNLIGEDRETLEADAKEFAAKHKIKNIPVVVPLEYENGPDNFGISPKADLTVMLYKGLKVQANHTYGPGQFKSKTASEVLADVPKLLE
ncbi:MAG TPA: hypothetical protein VMV10_23430 [Pirellulales bacterium]|nr:hypothetical protein [Pirellulales bacterium]